MTNMVVVVTCLHSILLSAKLTAVYIIPLH